MKKLLLILLIIPNLLFCQEQFSKEGEKYYEIGEKYNQNKDYEKAIINYEKAANLRYDFALFAIASYYNDLNKEDKVLEYLNKYIEIGGDYPWAFQMRANIHKEKERYNIAIDDYLKVIENDPSGEYVKDPFYSIGFCYIELENLNKACEYFTFSTTFEDKDWLTKNCK
tara:strand:- start:247 stop:753 length:507 start_codon:yes stop_codon:yes gene_type:complete